MGENIGAAARAMWNFGLDRMRVVAPRDGWPNERAVALASGAGRLLDHAGLYADVPEAISDSTYVYATTARERGLTKPVVTPERAMIEAREMIAARRQGRGSVRAGARGAGKPRHRAGQCHHLGAGEPGLPVAQPRAMRAALRL
jgi:tRNA/rRNA methyltransferase